MSLMSLTAVELGKKIKKKEVTVREAVQAACGFMETVATMDMDKNENTIELWNK